MPPKYLLMAQNHSSDDGKSYGVAVVRYNRTIATVLGSTVTALLAACSAGSSGPSISPLAADVAAVSQSVTQETQAPPVPVVNTFAPSSGWPKSGVGINVARSVYYSSERTFANLAKGAAVWRDQSAKWADIPASGLTAMNYPITGGGLSLNVPQTIRSGVDTQVTCTWTGSGNVRAWGDVTVFGRNHTLSFKWPGAVGAKANVFIIVDSISGTDPFANLDCREPGLATNGVFDQRLVNDLKPYAVLRFLDWSSANNNPAIVTWETRSTPDKTVQNGADGIALEHMIDLANATESDAWFTVPWNADQDYVQRMAVLVRDRLSSNHKAYFELSNETWNFGFSAARQALNEGIAENLSTTHYSNNPLRYAEKSTWLQKLLSNAFSKNMSRLVRVLNVQNGNTSAVKLELNFRDTAQYVDAIASAPYFGYNFFGGVNSGVTDLRTLFTSLETMRVDTIKSAVAVKMVAAEHGKSYIIYEGGQGIVPRYGHPEDLTVEAAMQRSPLMYHFYVRYLKDLEVQGIRTVVIYSATGEIGQHGAWGIREYAGQSLTETPKRRAVLGFSRKPGYSVTSNAKILTE